MVKDVRISFVVTLVLMAIGISANAQPVMITSVHSDVDRFTEVGDFVYFSSGDELWRTNGTAPGTIVLAGGFHPFPAEFIEFNGMNVFISGSQLWRSDGSPSGTIMLGSFEWISYLGHGGNYLYFTASDGSSGGELYRSDGTPGGTVLVKDINPGSANGVIYRQGALAGSHFFFAADNGADGVELWKTDGTSSGTVMVKDSNPGPGSGYSGGIPAAYEGKYYFWGSDPEHGDEPWVSDGTAAGTFLLKDITPGTAGHSGNFRIGNAGVMYFEYFRNDVDLGGSMVELWKTNGTAESTVRLQELCVDCRVELEYVADGDKIFFAVEDTYAFTSRVWESDGTIEGTREIFSEFLDGNIPFLGEANDYIFFYVTSQGNRLHLDAMATRAGMPPGATWQIKAVSPSSGALDIATVGDHLFFADHDGPHNGYGEPLDPDDSFQLIKSDGTSFRSLRDIYGISLTGTRNIVDFDGKVLFTTAHPASSIVNSLWIYDPENPAATLTLVNADTDEDIQTLKEGDVIVKPAGLNINIRYNPTGTPGSVVFEHQNDVVRRENAAPYSLAGDRSGNYMTWTGATPGNHRVEAIPYPEPNGQGTPGLATVVHFTIVEESNECIASGTITRDYWGGVQGARVSDIPLDQPPSSTGEITAFEGPENIGTNYASRIRGYICAPQSGWYTFWIASNDHSELWLSTDDNPDNKIRIAYLSRASNPREWSKFTTQRSAPIELVQGEKYYIEALHKQGIGTDHVSVGWQLPDGALERPIPGSRLAPFASTVSEMAFANLESTSEIGYSAISIFPNPAVSGNAEFTISGYESIEQTVETSVEIRNMTGEMVHSDRIVCGGDCNTYVMKIEELLVPGVYVVNLQTDDTRVSKRLLIK